MRNFAVGIAAAVLLLVGQALPAAAQLHVDVTQGTIQPMPIAIPDFAAPKPQDSAPAANIAAVIRADLSRSGLFKSLDPASFIDKIKDINTPPRFADWQVIKAQALVTGIASMQPDGRMEINFRLWDVYGQSQMLGLQYFTTPDNWRRVAHMISDAIYQRITGEKGYFNTRIVFISESGPATHRLKRLAVMDEDGANPMFLTNGSYIVLTPRFNPSAQMIAYMSYISGKPRVYLFDLETGKQQMLGNFPNMTFSPRFSPDGNKVVMSLEKNGNSQIYTMDLRTRAVTQLTNDTSINTSPCYSPDGTQIAFESDRGGSQQIYVMNADGSNQHRISFSPGRNGTPVWSPRGDLIAFTSMQPGAFRIAVMHPDGSGMRIISDGWQDEGPTWAPNGRVVMFTRTSRAGLNNQIWSVDVTGRNQQRVTTPGPASDPAWSPLIQ